MNTTQIECFLAVAQTLNFTQAAKSIFISQQAISKYISNLEEELGVRLFIRRHNEIELTAAGAYYCDFWNGWLNRIRLTVANCKQMRESMSLMLRVGISIWIDPFGEIDSGFSAFRKNYPYTTFKVRQYHNRQLIAQLDAGELDIVLIPSDQILLDSSYETAFLTRDQMCFYAPADVPGDSIDPDCWGLPFLEVPSWDWNSLEWKRIADREMSLLDIEPRHIITLPNFHSLLAMVRLRRCVVLCDDRFGYLRSYTGLKRFPLPSNSGLSCVWKKYSEHPLIPPFISHMQSWYAD